MNNFQIDDITNDIIGSRRLFIGLLILLIIFALLTFGFVFYPIYLMKQKVQNVYSQSKDALKSLNQTNAEGQTVLNGLNAAASEVNTINNAINGFIQIACDNLPFSYDQFCKDLK
jgi:Tfp pilus assembly protein PilO